MLVRLPLWPRATVPPEVRPRVGWAFCQLEEPVVDNWDRDWRVDYYASVRAALNSVAEPTAFKRAVASLPLPARGPRGERTVGEVMETVPFVVAPQATLDTFALALDGAGEATVARVMRGDELLGLVGAREIGRVPRGRWAAVHAAEVMAVSGGLPVLDPGDALGPAADRLATSSAPGLPVVREGSLAGILTRLAVGRTVHERAVANAERGDRR